MAQGLKEALLPPERDVMIGGTTYKVKRLTLKQLLQIGTLAGHLQQEVRARILEATEKGQPDMLAIVSAMKDEDSAHLLAVLLRADTPEDIARFTDASLEEISELAVAITEVNDFERMVANFLKAAENAKGLLKKTTPSLPSSGQ